MDGCRGFDSCAYEVARFFGLPTPGAALKGVKLGAKAVEEGAGRAAALAGKCGAKSFSGDTSVEMGDGSRKPILEIKVGDEVLATDPETGERGPRKVTHLWVHSDTLTDLEVEGGEVITTTEDHPFWNATDREYQRADQLDRGDQLLAADGRLVRVVGLRPGSQGVATAYNLTVEDIHTYYVLVGTTPVLVHNTGPCKNPLTADQQKDVANWYKGMTKLGGNYGKATVYEIKKPGAGLPRFYSRDIDQHGGGVFKGANRIEDLWRKETRSGTYGFDIDDNGMVASLVRVGD